jgi:hypothetical protein
MFWALRQVLVSAWLILLQLMSVGLVDSQERLLPVLLD